MILCWFLFLNVVIHRTSADTYVKTVEAVNGNEDDMLAMQAMFEAMGIGRLSEINMPPEMLSIEGMQEQMLDMQEQVQEDIQDQKLEDMLEDIPEQMLDMQEQMLEDMQEQMLENMQEQMLEDVLEDIQEQMLEDLQEQVLEQMLENIHNDYMDELVRDSFNEYTLVDDNFISVDDEMMNDEMMNTDNLEFEIFTTDSEPVEGIFDLFSRLIYGDIEAANIDIGDNTGMDIEVIDMAYFSSSSRDEDEDMEMISNPDVMPQLVDNKKNWIEIEVPPMEIAESGNDGKITFVLYSMGILLVFLSGAIAALAFNKYLNKQKDVIVEDIVVCCEHEDKYYNDSHDEENLVKKDSVNVDVQTENQIPEVIVISVN